MSQQTSEKERLLQEQSELEQNLEETRQSLCELCRSVSIEPGSDQDQDLQLLAKLSSPEAPISSPSHESKDEESQVTIEMLNCSSGCDRGMLPVSSTKARGRQIQEFGPQQCSSDPVSLLKDCLDMNNIL